MNSQQASSAGVLRKAARGAVVYIGDALHERKKTILQEIRYKNKQSKIETHQMAFNQSELEFCQ